MVPLYYVLLQPDLRQFRLELHWGVVHRQVQAKVVLASQFETKPPKLWGSLHKDLPGVEHLLILVNALGLVTRCAILQGDTSR